MKFVMELITNMELAILKTSVKTRVEKLAEVALRDTESVVPSKWAAEIAKLRIVPILRAMEQALEPVMLRSVVATAMSAK